MPSACAQSGILAAPVTGIGRLQRHVSDLLGYLERNQGALVHYAARRRCGEPIRRRLPRWS
jgi:hypothetical protein